MPDGYQIPVEWALRRPPALDQLIIGSRLPDYLTSSWLGKPHEPKR